MKLIACVIAAAGLAACGKSTCSTYTTQFSTTSSNNSNTNNTTCAFDKGALTETCKTIPATGTNVTATDIVIWPSLSAAASNAQPYGKTTYTHETVITSACPT